MKVGSQESEQNEVNSNFKAREMPKYKFFEVKHDVQKRI